MRFPVPRPLTTALLLALLVGTARADTLESRFRGFLDFLARVDAWVAEYTYFLAAAQGEKINKILENVTQSPERN